jgi:allantoinase
MNASDFADMVIDQFEEMKRQAMHQPLVMGVALHAMIAGQPHRIRHLRRALAHIAAQRDKCWLTTAGAIVQSAARLMP